jgi:hypothetical protein
MGEILKTYVLLNVGWKIILKFVPIFSSIDSMTPDYRESKCFLRGPEFLMGLTTTITILFDVT